MGVGGLHFNEFPVMPVLLAVGPTLRSRTLQDTTKASYAMITRLLFL